MIVNPFLGVNVRLIIFGLIVLLLTWLVAYLHYHVHMHPYGLGQLPNHKPSISDLERVYKDRYGKLLVAFVFAGLGWLCAVLLFCAIALTTEHAVMVFAVVPVSILYAYWMHSIRNKCLHYDQLLKRVSRTKGVVW